MIRFTLTTVAMVLMANAALANPCGFKQRGKIVVEEYAIGETQVPAPERERLAAFAETAKFRSNICIFAQVDATGTDEANRRVAEARAQSVRRFLAERGVPDDRMAIEKEETSFTLFGLIDAEQGNDRRVTVTHD
ncbi:MAG: OmpA family protein [Pseudomonadota bacterium]